MNSETQQIRYALVQAVYLATLMNANIPINFQLQDEFVVNTETGKEATLEDLVFILENLVDLQEFLTQDEEEDEEPEEEAEEHDTKLNSMALNEKEDKSKIYKRYFISPGLVSYQDNSKDIILLEKKIIDEALPGMIEVPVTLDHGGKEVGKVIEVFYDENVGEYKVVFSVDDPESQQLLDEENYAVSCGYDINQSEFGRKFWHALTYNRKVKDMKFTELAIVKSPRYQEAETKLNSFDNNKKGFFMNLFSKKKNSVEPKRNEVKFTVDDSGNLYISDGEEELDFREWLKQEGEEPAHEGTEAIIEEKEMNAGEDKNAIITKISQKLLAAGVDPKLVHQVMDSDEDLAYEQSTGETKDNAETDHRDLLREATAVAMKKDEDFKGGAEEKARTVEKILEKLAYTKDERNNSMDDTRKEQRADGLDRIEEDVREKDNKKCNSFPLARAYNSSQPIQPALPLTRRERCAKWAEEYL